MKNKNIDYKNLEVLSPAGSPECFLADLNAGADAIYLGLSNFNARMKAENFTTDNIKMYVDKAHLMGTKVYVTLNTLLVDDDFDELIALVKILVDAKVDAYIIQDLGVAYALKSSFDNINLHASTQLGIHNLYGAKVAEQLGFSRIVLSRETKLEDIKQIHENTNLEIEYFVQGALCVAFSGNCYLSSLEKQKSGNEGKCLQLCRLPYTNSLTNETAYNLSAKDLSLLENMQELIDAGVTSFKIEGRLKHAGYCAVTTKTYKQAIEKIKLNEFSKDFITENSILLRQTFSRGEFNKRAYLDKHTPDNIIYKDYQNHIGVEIGNVLSVNNFKNNLYKVKIQSKYELHNGDGIKIIDKSSKNQICSLGIGDILSSSNNIYEFVTKHKFPANTSVFLTQNSEYENKILSEKRLLNIDINLSAFSGNYLKATVYYNDTTFEFSSNFLLEKAQNKPLSSEDFFTQINKLSETEFKISNFSVNTDGVFIPKSLLNAFRRDLIENLKNHILENYPMIVAKFNSKNHSYLSNLEFINNLQPKNIAIIDECCEEFEKYKNFDIIVLKPSIYSLEIISKFYNLFKEKLALNLPTIANFNDIKIIDEILEKLPKDINLYANNIYGLYYSKKYEVITSPLLNTKNTFAIRSLFNFGIRTLSASIESSVDYANNNNLIGFKDGLFPLMTFAHCPFKTIFNNTCKNCSFSKNLNYSNPNLNTYKITRIKIFNCYFELNTHFSQKNIKFFTINYSK